MFSCRLSCGLYTVRGPKIKTYFIKIPHVDSFTAFSLNTEKYVSLLSECGAASLDDWCPTFRNDVVVSS